MLKKNLSKPDTAPHKFEKTYIDTIAFAQECHAFLEERFAGACEYEADSRDFKVIHVCPDGYSHIIAFILKKLYGNRPLTISFSKQEDEFRVTLKFNPNELSEKELENLNAIAARSGFTMRRYKNCIVLIAEASDVTALSIYSRSELKIYRSLLNAVEN